MATIYYDTDADLANLSGRVVSILGYGSQGHAHARNLRDSGVEVAVADAKGSPTYAQAEADGFKVLTASEAAAKGSLIMMLLPDTVQRRVYEAEVRQHLTDGKALYFAHGFNIHFNQIVPPAGVDVCMIAPKAPGHLVRRMYEEGMGTPALVAIHQDATGKALPTALAYAKALGATRAGVIGTTFREETETDLFGEQAVLCGGVTELIKAGFDTLVQAGYQPEIAYFECLHELKLIVDLIYEGGLARMRYSISDTAEYGDYSRGKRIITDETRAEMRKILAEITTGRFATEWINENLAGQASFLAQRRVESEHLIEIVGGKLRAMMPWIRAR